MGPLKTNCRYVVDTWVVRQETACSKHALSNTTVCVYCDICCGAWPITMHHHAVMKPVHRIVSYVSFLLVITLVDCGKNVKSVFKKLNFLC